MPEAGAELDALAAELYGVWFRYRPELALAAGVHPRGPWVSPVDDNDVAALRSWLETAILGLDEIDFDALDPDRQIDFELMAGAVRVEHAELLDFDWRARDPGRFLPVAEIERLTLDPPDPLRPTLVELLSAIPERLRQAQSDLRGAAPTLAPLLVRTAVRETEGLRRALRTLLQAPWLRQRCYGLAALETLAEAACAALAGYRDYLAQGLAPAVAGGLGCGVGHLRLRLRYLHFMDWDPLDLIEPIARERRAAEASLAGPAGRSELDGPGPGGAADGDRLRLHREVCDALAAELEASALASLPRAPLRVAEAPICVGLDRYATGYLADRAADGGGTLWVAPGLPSGQGETLDRVRSRCLASGWGGSHLLAWAAPEPARRLARRVCNGASLRMAWGLYLSGRLTQLARDWAGAADDSGLGYRLERRERFRLAELDLDLHSGRCDVAAALERLAGWGINGRAADAALARIALAPGDALAGALGCGLLADARARAEAALGERAFNDRLIGQGAIPLPLALRGAFGGRAEGGGRSHFDPSPSALLKTNKPSGS